MLDSTQTAIDVLVTAAAADGGTLCISVRTASARYDLYVDGRVMSNMRGEIWTAYPGSDGAKLLDPDAPLTRSIKRLLMPPSPGICLIS